MVSSKGNAALASGNWIYLFDNDHDLISKVGCNGFKPGQFPYRNDSIGISDEDGIVAADLRRRVNTYDDSGDFTRALSVPEFSLSALLTKKHKNLLV